MLSEAASGGRSIDSSRAILARSEAEYPMPEPMPHERWERLKRGDGCPICADAHLDDNPFSIEVAELEQSWFRFGRNQAATGWCIVILKRHANELWELADDELAGFWRDVARAARA